MSLAQDSDQDDRRAERRARMEEFRQMSPEERRARQEENRRKFLSRMQTS